ncbi:alkane 1-monooxygenase [Persicobacter diffluens]|uniref:Alkane 1-monooxygenase n=1 Tax=Persicobacter diffluens TaxID=981 RepID=A0AAN4W2Z8_9BACT|nr:alkane 1-monooxygenase [Persicobacter diffluens]
MLFYFRYLLKYLIAFILPLLVYLSFQWEEWASFIPFFYAFGFIPLLELFLRPDVSNPGLSEEEQLKANRIFDFLLLLAAGCQFGILWLFLKIMAVEMSNLTFVGHIMSMGLMCGVFGINVAHELGHRKSPFMQWTAKFLLMSSLYMHFFIEHNRGHHRYVATPLDPATARKGENIFFFWGRSMVFSWQSAWKLAAKSVQRKYGTTWSWHNEMLQFLTMQLVWLSLIFFLTSPKVFLAYLLAALLGCLLLESVNYIEHYGLLRKQLEDGSYERTRACHSWNSNHQWGRATLFELSRHSDHHYLASRKYQILRHHEEAPQLPTGYPGMILLAFLPPLWFKVMHSKLDEIRNPVSISRIG